MRSVTELTILEHSGIRRHRSFPSSNLPGKGGVWRFCLVNHDLGLLAMVCLVGAVLVLLVGGNRP